MAVKWTDGSAYESYVGRWSRPIGEKFLKWLDAPGNMRWLDLGCGTGALTSQILLQCDPKSVLGVEPSEGFLELAREQIADQRAEFSLGTGTEIPVDNNSVDVAVSGLVLNFIPDQTKAMAELKRSTVPGGMIAAYVWDYAGHVQFMRYFWDAAIELNPDAKNQDEGERFPICRPKPLAKLFEDSGLTNVKVEPIDIPTAFRDFDDYWNPFLSGIAPAPGYCMSLDEAHREKLKNRVKEMLPTDPDGKILIAARAWAVRGTNSL